MLKRSSIPQWSRNWIVAVHGPIVYGFVERVLVTWTLNRSCRSSPAQSRLAADGLTKSLPNHGDSFTFWALVKFPKGSESFSPWRFAKKMRAKPSFFWVYPSPWNFMVLSLVSDGQIRVFPAFCMVKSMGYLVLWCLELGPLARCCTPSVMRWTFRSLWPAFRSSTVRLGKLTSADVSTGVSYNRT